MGEMEGGGREREKAANIRSYLMQKIVKQKRAIFLIEVNYTR